MRIRIPLGLALIALFTLVMVGVDPSKARDDAEETAIRKVLDDQVAAWNKGDLKGFMAGYWNDEKLSFYSGKDKTFGWKQTLERYEKRYQGEGKEMGKLEFVETDIRRVGERHALVRSGWQLTLSKEKVGGLFTVIFEKTKDGWKVIHDHTSG